jgi:hypothetical protein
MQLTKQQKIYAAVLLLAAVAFGVDRWVIGHGPEGVSAAAPRTRTSGAQAAPTTVAPGAGGVTGVAISAAPAVGSTPFGGASTAGARQGPSRSLAARFQEVVRVEGLDLTSVPDAFRPSRRWDPPNAAPVTPVAPPPPKFDLAAQFRSHHKLNAVMGGRAGMAGAAVVDDKYMILVGQQYDGLTLVAVDKDRAVFSGPGATPDDKLTVQLVIDKPSLDMHLQE